MMLPDIPLCCMSPMKESVVCVTKSVDMLGLAPHCVLSRSSGSSPFMSWRRKELWTFPMVLLSRMPRTGWRRRAISRGAALDMSSVSWSGPPRLPLLAAARMLVACESVMMLSRLGVGGDAEVRAL
eukprot:9468291-Pyramimonas_sp.AAC.1